MSVLEDLHALEERVAARLRELRPLVEEYAELQRTAERLKIDVDAAPRSAPSGGRAAAAPKRTRPAGRRRRASQRTAKGGTRAKGAERRARMLSLIEERPGITVRELSRELGVDAPPLYRVVRKLQAEGVVKKEGQALRRA